MESVTAKRRMQIIAGHLTVAGKEEVAGEYSSTRISPLNCSSTPDFVGRRCDNRVLFGRQGSIYQARFMRQVSVEEVFGHGSQADAHLMFSDCKNDEPLFARQAKSDAGEHLSVKQECKFSEISGFKALPRLYISESGSGYVVTAEFPGVSMNDIKIELDNRSLIIMSKRSIPLRIAANVSVNSSRLYHQGEIVPGPNQVVWPLPNDVNKDNVSTEIQDGFVRITFCKF